jgi:hypothetical protein
MMRYIAKDVQLSMYADKEQLVALELLSELPQIPYTTLGAQCLDTIAPVNHVSPESLAITGESLRIVHCRIWVRHVVQTHAQPK